MKHSLTEEQIENIIESDSYLNKEYFLWTMDESIEDKSMSAFFLAEEVYKDLEEPVVALMQHTGGFYSDAAQDISNRDYLVLDDIDADDRAREYSEDSVSDAKRDIPEHLQRYFDDNLYINDMLDEGRGSILAMHDGVEYEEVVNGTTYYIYKQ